MHKTPPRILVLTLYHGEAEYEICKTSVMQQLDVETEHTCFEWLTNIDAHEAIYRTIMNRSEEFDAFIKLDADMVFVHKRALLEAYQIMLEQPKTDHLSIPVYDHPSGRFLMGFHIFSSRCTWKFPLDPNFPDQNPNVLGVQRIDFKLKRRIIDHMPSPSTPQAYSLGAHRASKIVQIDRKWNIRQSRAQLRYIKRVASNQLFDRNLQFLILLGMFETMLFNTPISNYKSLEVPRPRSKLAEFLSHIYSLPLFRELIFQVLCLRYLYVHRLIFLSKKILNFS